MRIAWMTWFISWSMFVEVENIAALEVLAKEIRLRESR